MGYRESRSARSGGRQGYRRDRESGQEQGWDSYLHPVRSWVLCGSPARVFVFLRPPATWPDTERTRFFSGLHGRVILLWATDLRSQPRATTGISWISFGFLSCSPFTSFHSFDDYIPIPHDCLEMEFHSPDFLRARCRGIFSRLPATGP